MEATSYVPNNPQYGLEPGCCELLQPEAEDHHQADHHQVTCRSLDQTCTSTAPACYWGHCLQPPQGSLVFGLPPSHHLEQHHHDCGGGLLVGEGEGEGEGCDEEDMGGTGPLGSTWCSGDQVSTCTGDMGTFCLPLDLEPLPTLFPFSPPPPVVPPSGCKGEPLLLGPPRQPADLAADVLLSLKHAVVHDQQPQPPPQPPPTYQQHFTCTVPPPTAATAQQPYPSMSVNVSMNMTYHAPPPPPQHHQLQQYTGLCGTPLTVDHQPPPAMAQWQPAHAQYVQPATYCFTADFVPRVTTTARRHEPPPDATSGQCGRPNLCRICGKTYARPSTLKTHLRTHSGEKPYRCADCHKSFSQAANLTAHVRTHSGEKPFRCPICDRRFSQSSSVTTHMRTHSGERPYRCRACRKAFSDSSTLTKHLRIHSGEKPYQCKLCLLRFSQSGNLNRHMRVHGAQAAQSYVIA